MNLDPRSLPEALQDNPPRHPQWAIEEAAAIERAERMRRLRVAALAAAVVAASIAALGLARWGGLA